MESILITGASGFIGSFIVQEALKRRFGVWAGIRASSSKKYLKERKIHFLELDFAHPNELRAQLSGSPHDRTGRILGKARHAGRRKHRPLQIGLGLLQVL